MRSARSSCAPAARRPWRCRCRCPVVVPVEVMPAPVPVTYRSRSFRRRPGCTHAGTCPGTVPVEPVPVPVPVPVVRSNVPVPVPVPSTRLSRSPISTRSAAQSVLLPVLLDCGIPSRLADAVRTEVRKLRRAVERRPIGRDGKRVVRAVEAEAAPRNGNLLAAKAEEAAVGHHAVKDRAVV